MTDKEQEDDREYKQEWTITREGLPGALYCARKSQSKLEVHCYKPFQAQMAHDDDDVHLRRRAGGICNSIRHVNFQFI